VLTSSSRKCNCRPITASAARGTGPSKCRSDGPRDGIDEMVLKRCGYESMQQFPELAMVQRVGGPSSIWATPDRHLQLVPETRNQCSPAADELLRPQDARVATPCRSTNTIRRGPVTASTRPSRQQPGYFEITRPGTLVISERSDYEAPPEPTAGRRSRGPGRWGNHLTASPETRRANDLEELAVA
jgi:hypothetical protein